MIITIYTKDQCPNCVTAKQLLKAKSLSFEERNVANPEFMDQLTNAWPEARQLPQIFIDGQRVGGLAGLQAALKQVGV
jgi:glutaredoxin 3